MNRNETLWGTHTVCAYGGIFLESRGYGLDLVASGTEGTVTINGSINVQMVSGTGVIAVASSEDSNTICISAGEEGMIKQVVGSPMVGAMISMEPELITISVGAEGEGSSISMTPESITFKVADVTFSMTPEGINEVVDDTTRSNTPAGHVLEAADGSFEVTPAAISLEAPTIEITGDGMITMEGAIVNVN
ncbi:hypothetical protein [Blastopirellula marina]|uniref:Uncharacterized protein n=1 Tax=Blastopirellula marina DSM 3645 TaxID=314230 RepID=A3ZN29_9BACT|nr:hypothetical protein [Blastopirellula marina]EAQ82358.1 hypothetical protein DSM3645_01550 [Blastopirellula marina DSM 3645]